MKMKSMCNFLHAESFKSKDGKKTYFNGTFLVEDLTVKCSFLKEVDFNFLQTLKRLDLVECQFDVLPAQQNNLYQIRLDSVTVPAFKK